MLFPVSAMLNAEEEHSGWGELPTPVETKIKAF